MEVFDISQDAGLRRAALAVINSDIRLNRRSGAFLGQVIAEPMPLSPKQLDWFEKLAERAGVDLEY